MNPLSEPEPKPRTSNMLFGLLALVSAVVVITIAALSMRHQDDKMTKLEHDLEKLRHALADSIEQDEALADAIAAIAAENQLERGH